MKIKIIMLAITALVLPVLAEETNTVSQPKPSPEFKPVESAPPEEGRGPKPTPEQRKEFKERHLKMMERALDEIGVTEEQRQQIFTLQEAHLEKMKANWKRINKARRELSRLQDSGAPMEELDAAIKEVTDAQAEQLQILVRNRMEMERILGKEKSDQFMQKAREIYRLHGRRPGAGLPPRPDVPPVPNNNQSAGTPPTPPVGADDGEMPPTP